MVSGGAYRISSSTGVVVATILAVVMANSIVVQRFVTSTVPIVDRLNPVVLSGPQLLIAIATTLAVVAIALTPLYKPRPRRILTVVYRTHRRLTIAGFAIATLGYFDWTYRLPRSTLIVSIGTLFVVLPTWFVAIRRRPANDPGRAIIIGDDLEEIHRTFHELETTVLGYVSPPFDAAAFDDDRSVDVAAGIRDQSTRSAVADGSGVHVRIPSLGGLSRLEHVLVEHDVDTAVFAFDRTDRQEFFGVLTKCHEHGVDVKIPREKADTVLVANDPGEEIVDVDVEPWDWQERLLKRAFDVAFSSVGLLVASPLMAVVAIAIKLDSDGPVLYSQERTAELGETFTVYKFRSMIADAEAQTGAKLSEEDRGGVDPRVTRVGRVLRQTHLDEIPQLWSILKGDMSAVGPRPERPELDTDIELEKGVMQWRQRWFVKPGLTGLAQVNDATGHEPEKKLRYDVEYIRRQSFRYDVAIVIRQIWNVLDDVVETVRDNYQ